VVGYTNIIYFHAKAYTVYHVTEAVLSCIVDHTCTMTILTETKSYIYFPKIFSKWNFADANKSTVTILYHEAIYISLSLETIIQASIQHVLMHCFYGSNRFFSFGNLHFYIAFDLIEIFCVFWWCHLYVSHLVNFCYFQQNANLCSSSYICILSLVIFPLNVAQCANN
jgi:hypothetical protein